MEERLCKKIRILSFQNAYNFGAILQAYGLQQTIKSFGYDDVKFINYNPKYLRDRYNPFAKEFLLPYKTIKGFIGWCLFYPFSLISRLHRNRRLRKSIKSLLCQTEILVVDENGLTNEEADVLICGSDQIWNTSLTGDFDVVFFGKGRYRHLGYAVSYAPSTELSALTEKKAYELSLLLDGFKYISVREVPIKERLQKYVSKEINVCVDPTILCGTEAFRQIASPRQEKRDYILVYAYDPNDLAIKNLIKSIPNYKNYPVHTILLGSKNFFNFFDSNVHAAISIPCFLSYFKYAKYVITNSFHGLSFSILFEKNFNVAFCEGKYVRCLSLLQQLGIEGRFVHLEEKGQWDNLDYSQINSNINTIRKKSRDYLEKILEG